ncbi:glycosyltransferase [Rhodoplanes sp. TEM]|uniref:Glycosyltransferase n=1 Tax=Rhodoplanes tepidamans TaxID=200616 RepID=A0ABT5J761_RHOTP|nr:MULTISPECIES: glycosyltransferase [Rhodoplanes]MDC7785491.1 glycosyltransferase [Rhodoplanes tepidamans]MDC7986164.1 glycosyltransferase [Rhodoplanes sp. TEM]MDQ0353339.1 spore maturation protein CgeB [Rhodoplanes tepidamans]
MTLDIVVLGLSITSSWGNGHATTYRALIKALAERGHRVTFLERDVAWYRDHRDLRRPDWCRVELYRTLTDLPRRHAGLVRDADLVILGSFVPDGAAIADWVTSQARGVTAFYDIDTPVTLARLERGVTDYIAPALVPRFDVYLSFTGGPVLELIEQTWGARAARPLYCAVDPDIHRPHDVVPHLALGYIGTYSPDRQRTLDRLLVEPARRLPALRFAVAGPQYPAELQWPANVERIDHLPPQEHARFYCGQRYTLNVTRADMIAAGWSPSVRLFEAGACGVPVISDRWAGLDGFYTPGTEILIADSTEQAVAIIREMPEDRRRDIAAAARRRTLACHTARERARALEEHYAEAAAARTRRDAPRVGVGAVA